MERDTQYPVGFNCYCNVSVDCCIFIFISLLSLELLGSIVTFRNCLVAVYFMLAKWFDSCLNSYLVMSSFLCYGLSNCLRP